MLKTQNSSETMHDRYVYSRMQIGIHDTERRAVSLRQLSSLLNVVTLPKQFLDIYRPRSVSIAKVVLVSVVSVGACVGLFVCRRDNS